MNSSNSIKEFWEKSASDRVCSSTREHGMLNRVGGRTERACGALARLVKSKPVIGQVVTGKEFEMETKFPNIAGVVDML